MTYGYRYERVHNFVPESPDEFFIVNISKITAAGIVDRRDEPFEPTRGWFSSLNWEQAVTALGSDSPSAKVLFQQFYFRSMGKLVLASRAPFQIAFQFRSAPIELYLELSLMLRVIDDHDDLVDLGGGLGFRIYF